MVLAIALVSLLHTIVSQPWFVNHPEETIQNDPYILDPTQLEFIDFEDETGIPWKDTLLIITIVCLVFLAVWQFLSMKQENEEVDAFLAQCCEDHESVTDKELEMILQYMDEDSLSLEEVARDT